MARLWVLAVLIFLAFIGWTVELAGVSGLQGILVSLRVQSGPYPEGGGLKDDAPGTSSRACASLHDVLTTAQDRAAQASLSPDAIAYTDSAYENIWWTIWLQFVAFLIVAAATLSPKAPPVSRLGATFLLAVVVLSTYVQCNSVYNNPFTFKLTHSVGSGGSSVDANTNYHKTGRYVLALLSGSIIFAVASSFLLIVLPDPPTAEAKESSAV